MRILIDAHLSVEETDGIGRYLNELLPALLKLDQRDEYVVLTYAGNSTTHPLSTLEAPNLLKIPVKLHGLDWTGHLVISKILREMEPDVYHHPHFDLPWFHNIPSVITIHDLKYIRHPEFFKGFSRVKRFYMKTMLGHSLKRTQKVIAVSKSGRDDIISVFNTPVEKISIVAHGVNSSCEEIPSAVDVPNLLRSYGIRDKFILFVGVKRPHKNLGRLIEAFDILCKKTGALYQLVIVGKSYSDYCEPQDKVKELGLTERVIFTEYVSHDELPLFYHAAEVFVMPSLYEGFGLPVLEAMSSGTPVIASNLTSLPEIVGEAGILVDPFDTIEIAKALEKVVTNRSISEDLRRKGAERARHFSWEKTAEQTLAVYQEVCQKIK